jgi:hypothetical protein
MLRSQINSEEKCIQRLRMNFSVRPKEEEEEDSFALQWLFC